MVAPLSAMWPPACSQLNLTFSNIKYLLPRVTAGQGVRLQPVAHGGAPAAAAHQQLIVITTTKPCTLLFLLPRVTAGQGV
jgi:hypothetical protein